jgi:hypothetical protein
MPDTPARDESRFSTLLSFFAGAAPPRALWKLIVAGIAIIVGFWITWFPLRMFLVFTDFLFISGALGGGYPYQIIHDVWRVALYLVVLFTMAFVSISVWKSVEKALAARWTQNSARISATVCALATALLFAGAGEAARVMTWIYSNDILDTYDPHRTSLNAAKRIKPDPSFPLTGFWQTSCDSDGGISIERESRLLRLYRIEECSKFACNLGDDSKIVGDPKYRIVDSNTIEYHLPENAYTIVSGTRVNTLTYHRCS